MKEGIHDLIKLRELDKTLPLYEEFHSGNEKSFDAAKVIEDIKNYEALNPNGRGVPILADFQKLSALYIGEEVEKHFGYKREELMSMGSHSIFKLLSLEHIGFPLRALTWAKMLNKYKDKKQKDHICYMCGMKFKNKKRELIRGFFELRELSTFENGNPHLVLIIATDVSHLVKGNFYWGYYQFGPEQAFTRFLDSKLLTKPRAEVFTTREMDVLRCLYKGMSSKEIGDGLFISTGTVEKHRKNMISRIGAKDTTALLELGRMMDLKK